MRGLEYPHQLEITVDGVRVHLASFGGDKEIAASSENPTTTGDDVDGRFTVRVPLKAGPHAHHDRVPREDARAQHAPAAELRAQLLRHHRLLGLSRTSIEIIFTGPFNPTGPGDTPSRRRIFVCRPGDRRPTRSRARARILSRARAARLPRRLHRRRSRRVLLDFFRRGRAGRRTLRGGHRSRAAPHAGQPEVRLPRRARSGRASAPGAAYALSDLELASRLSFFLWSSIPDDELLDAGGAQAACTTPATLERQVRRMLADPKAQALVDNFVGQWLQLRNLRNKQPNSHEFPDFDDNLRRALDTETRAVLRLDHARGPQRARSDDGRLHVRQRAAGEALRHPEHLRQPLPPRHAGRRRAQGPARQGRDPDGDLARAPHVAGAARQVGARERARHAAAAAARRGAAVRGRGRSRQAASRCASGWSSTAATRRAPAATG